MNENEEIAENETLPVQTEQKIKRKPVFIIATIAVLAVILITVVITLVIAFNKKNDYDNLVFGYYDKIPIAWVYGNVFTQYYERTFQEYQYWAYQQGRDVNDPEIMRYIWREAYEGTVVHTAILHMMKKSHYLTPKKAVDRSVAKHSRFQDNGKFSPSLYRETPEDTRLAIWQQTQDELGKMMFFNDYFELLTSTGEAEFVANMSAPTRSFDLVSFQVDEYPESEYLAYAQSNIELFNTIHMSKITVESEKEAKRILTSIKDGTTTFEEAAGNLSLDAYADKDGDMGRRYVFELQWEIQNADDRDKIFSLKRGELSDVISVGDSWAFFRIENILTPPELDNSIVMDRVRMYVNYYARGQMEDWAINDANNFIAQAKEVGFRNAAASSAIKVNSFGPLPVNYGGVELFTSLNSFTIPGTESYMLKEMERNENFWKIAFSTPINTPSQPMVQGSNVLVFYPSEEYEEEAEEIEYIAQFYSNEWVKFVSERSLQSFFINNEKMDDRFEEIYRRLFR